MPNPKPGEAHLMLVGRCQNDQGATVAHAVTIVLPAGVADVGQAREWGEALVQMANALAKAVPPGESVRTGHAELVGAGGHPVTLDPKLRGLFTTDAGEG